MVNFNKIRMQNYDCSSCTYVSNKIVEGYCSYSHPYIILLEAGTDIHASYVNNLYDPRWIKNGTTIIDTIIDTPVNTKNSDTIIR